MPFELKKGRRAGLLTPTMHLHPRHAPTPLQLQLPPLRDSPLPETPPTSLWWRPTHLAISAEPCQGLWRRPRVSAPHRNPRGAQRQMPEWKNLQEAQETAAHVEAQMLQLEAERMRLRSEIEPSRETFTYLNFFAARPEDPKTTAMVTKALRTHGPELLDKWVERAPESVDAFPLSVWPIWDWVMRLKEMAPTWWEVLTAASSTHSPSTEVPETRRDRSLKANNFQAVIALFLLGSGASKREIEVFAHAGISLSYKQMVVNNDKVNINGVRLVEVEFYSAMPPNTESNTGSVAAVLRTGKVRVEGRATCGNTAETSMFEKPKVVKYLHIGMRDPISPIALKMQGSKTPIVPLAPRLCPSR
ncbi:hypothetical protein B0H14DRAFT_2595428 [Mycena olivaceomarginata]|nr:hypothetical protein B0H14DRAFT_2595428 [Mycena olivaceomarginata]